MISLLWSSKDSYEKEALKAASRRQENVIADKRKYILDRVKSSIGPSLVQWFSTWGVFTLGGKRNFAKHTDMLVV